MSAARGTPPIQGEELSVSARSFERPRRGSDGRAGEDAPQTALATFEVLCAVLGELTKLINYRALSTRFLRR